MRKCFSIQAESGGRARGPGEIERRARKTGDEDRTVGRANGTLSIPGFWQK